MTAPARSLPPVTPGALAAPAAPTWLLWTCLWIIYVVWGSTYLAIRVVVETMPPLLASGARFLLAGLLVLGVLTIRGGWARIRPSRRELAGALVVGLLLCGANGVISVGETDVPSAFAALLVASVPLIVIVLRRVTGERLARASVAGVAVGFVGVAILLLPGKQPDGASMIGMLAVLAGAVMWATGTFASPRIGLPRDPFVSTGWQMLLGGVVCTVAGLGAGEGSGLHADAFSTRSLAAWVYLVAIGSLVAFSAYVWLLQNAPVSKVATYAYVNPVIAILLGWLLLDETISPTTIVGAGIIVFSVAVVVRLESRSRSSG